MYAVTKSYNSEVTTSYFENRDDALRWVMRQIISYLKYIKFDEKMATLIMEAKFEKALNYWNNNGFDECQGYDISEVIIHHSVSDSILTAMAEDLFGHKNT